MSFRHTNSCLLYAALVGACAATTVTPACALPASIAPAQLHCEYATNPLGIDSAHPRLSWICAETQKGDRGLRQTAFQVVVASTPERLARGTGDLWNSGRVSSNRSNQIAYAGRPLLSRQRCFWKVRVWDQAGTTSEWSNPARWEMGLLRPADWLGKWIAGTNAGVDLSRAHWIWTDEADRRFFAPEGMRYFRKQVDLPASIHVIAASAAIAADNRFVLYVNGHEVAKGTGYKSAPITGIARFLRPGANVLAVAATNDGNEAGVLGAISIKLSSGTSVRVPLDSTWKCTKTAAAGWQQASFDDSGWSAAQVLAANGASPWGKVTAFKRGLPVFRCVFTASQIPVRATAYVCGLGQYDMRVNGSKVGNGLLEPGWTNYRKTCLYGTYDITSKVKAGKNAVGILLGNGMYNVVGGRYVKFTGSFGEPKVIAQICLDYANGAHQVIATGPTWKTAQGPITFSCTYGGEDYDARDNMPGWDTTGFRDHAWRPAVVTVGPGGRLVGASQSAPPIVVHKTIEPVSKRQIRSGVWVYDLGQNCSIMPRIRVHGPAGARVTIYTGESFGDNDFNCTCSKMATYNYVLRGKGVETWTPRFTYVGARYLLVDGCVPAGEPAIAGLPVADSVEGLFVSSSVAETGAFACSSTLYNRTYSLIRWAMRSNTMSVFTDCPHREKLGWLEQDHLVGPSMMYSYDVPRLMNKVTHDTAEAQLPNGLVPDIAPEYVVFNAGFRDSPEWGAAAILVPWQTYEWYGDVDILRNQYSTMKRYVDYLSTMAKENIVSHGLADWLAIEPTSAGQTASAFYYACADIVAQTAKLLGKTGDEQHYRSLANAIRSAYNVAFYDANARHYAGNTQAANAMPVVMGIVEPGNAQAVVDAIVADVHNHGNALTAGDVGYRYVVRALASHGRSDVVFDMNSRSDKPGYGMMLARGATSLPESWDANPGASLNHFMMGHIMEWFYGDLAGIQRDPAEPGYHKIVIRPQIVGDITWARAHYDSVHGRIRSAWTRHGSALTLNVEIPPNTTATVYVPSAEGSRVLESNRAAAAARSVRFSRVEDGCTVYEVGSGTYIFTSALP